MSMTLHKVTCLKKMMLNVSSSNNLYLKHGTLQSHQAAKAGIHTFEPENCKGFVHRFSPAQVKSQAYWSSSDNDEIWRNCNKLPIALFRRPVWSWYVLMMHHMAGSFVMSVSNTGTSNIVLQYQVCRLAQSSREPLTFKKNHWRWYLMMYELDIV